jgi:hypothetical protein
MAIEFRRPLSVGVYINWANKMRKSSDSWNKGRGSRNAR